MMQAGEATPERDQDPEGTTQLRSSGSMRMGLYVLPAGIVLVFILGWLFVFWLLHEDQDPQSLVRGMQQPGRRSWQKAYALSELLTDPDHDNLRDDAYLCRALVTTLEQQNRQARQARDAGEVEDEELAQFRKFLCRAVGEFRLLDGLPVLLDTAAAYDSASSPTSSEQRVRQAAIESIAVLATNVGPDAIQDDSQVIELLADACQSSGSAGDIESDTDIASAATFALGVIGGPLATEQLLQRIGDTRPDVRYNAASGLARHGRAEAIPVVLEMLDPENGAIDDGAIDDGRQSPAADARKQWMILSNAVEAAARLLSVASFEERKQLTTALQKLSDSQIVSARVRIDAQQALLKRDQP